jgi:hypothetical protein
MTARIGNEIQGGVRESGRFRRFSIDRTPSPRESSYRPPPRNVFTGDRPWFTRRVSQACFSPGAGAFHLAGAISGGGATAAAER